MPYSPTQPAYLGPAKSRTRSQTTEVKLCELSPVGLPKIAVQDIVTKLFAYTACDPFSGSAFAPDITDFAPFASFKRFVSKVDFILFEWPKKYSDAALWEFCYDLSASTGLACGLTIYLLNESLLAERAKRVRSTTELRNISVCVETNCGKTSGPN